MNPEQPFIVQAKLTPPHIQKHTLLRPRISERLLDSPYYRITILQAGAGYGKTTALALFARQQPALVWLQLERADQDPLLFLAHLLHGFAEIETQWVEHPAALLNQNLSSGRLKNWTAILDALNNTLAEQKSGPIYLVLDDVHLVNESAVMMRLLDWLIGRAAPQLHILLATRYPLNLPHLLSWRVRGEVQEIGRAELAFTPLEISNLLGQMSGRSIAPAQLKKIAARTEGWAIAVQLIRQQLTRYPQHDVSQALAQLSAGEGDLFGYLAREVLQQLPAEIQHFLRHTAVLRELSAPACDYLLQRNDSDTALLYLEDNDLFVSRIGPGLLRHHLLFRELLYQQLTREEARQAHTRAAAYFKVHEDTETMIRHLFAADLFEEAAHEMVQIGRKYIRQGRIDMLARWIGLLPPEILETHPMLLSLLGDVARLHSHFDEALGWYQQAEKQARAQQDLPIVSQALRGQARVYLDTVNPSKADELLQEALRLSDGQESRESRARLLDLLAENLLNRGQMDAARDYQTQARTLREEGPGPEELSVRLLIRTGRLAEARRILELRAAAEESAPVQRPRAHRETLLLLSLIMAFQGEQEAALQAAKRGTQRGRVLASPFITAVGHMRQGHAWLLDKNQAGYEKAIRCFQEAITISEALLVPRLKVEACWGLAQAHGFRGDLAQAISLAEEGIAIAREAGDEWIEGLVRTVVGAAHVLAGQYHVGHIWLQNAGTIFEEVRDTFGQSVVGLWRCLAWTQTGDEDLLAPGLRHLLRLVHTSNYAFLFLAPTLLGPPDERSLIPLLILARNHDWEGAYARDLLNQTGLPQIQFHPGYQLRIQTLGEFRVWRGHEEVLRRDWQRQKARELFQFLITHRHRLLERDQITEMLWPELNPEEAERDFKVAYNQMCRVLEPGRTRNAPSAYVVRDGSCYGLRPEADLVVDADRFLSFIETGDSNYPENPEQALAPYHQAMALYHGEYLPALPYAEWCSEERERLLTEFLRIAERAAQIHMHQHAWEAAIQVCRQILACDDCWESAYRMMMEAYARQGNHAQVTRIYQRCTGRLQAELGIPPSPTTRALFESLSSTL